MKRRIAATAWLILLTACGEASRDCAINQWSCDEQVDMVTQAQCDGADLADETPIELELAERSGALELQVKHHWARCNQELCAYANEAGSKLEVLVQPCDLHPEVVPRCSCRYDLTISVPARKEVREVVLYTREDEYASKSKPERVGSVKHGG